MKLDTSIKYVTYAVTIFMLGACGLFNESSQRGEGDAECRPSQANQGSNTKPSSFGIIGGVDTTDFPAVVMLTLESPDGIGVCTATFIGHNTLLTAGHCVNGYAIENIKVHTAPRNDPRQVVSSLQGIPVLQKFSALPDPTEVATAEKVAQDFAVLITPPNAAPAIVPFSYNPIAINIPYDIVGYGRNTEQGGSGVKRTAEIIVLSNGVSEPIIVTGAIFAAEVPNAGAQQLGRAAKGDSGGPLFDKSGTLVGVTSVGLRLKAGNPTGIENASGFHALASQTAAPMIEQARLAGAKPGEAGSNSGFPGPTLAGSGTPRDRDCI